MLAEARDPLTATWKPPSPGKDNKGPGIPQGQQDRKYQQQSAEQGICFLGFEVRQKLIWDDWVLGGEYTKTLVLKNIHNKLRRLHVRPPASKFFSTTTSSIISLSPGISFSIPVTFRPIKWCEYEDSIEFQSKESRFQVCLRAIIPCRALELPESVLLPTCAVQHSSHTTFLLKNASKLQTYFKWETALPFQLSPEQGLLKPGQDCSINVCFQPQEALFYRRLAICRFGEEAEMAESCDTVLIQAIAKYPFLQLKNPISKGVEEHGYPVLHFGSVAVGQSVQRPIDIFNPCPVSVPFSLSQLSTGIPFFRSEFSCDVTRGELAPGGSLRAMVTYTPAVVDAVSVCDLSLKYRGALSKSLLKLTGKCIGPKVSLSSSVVDFGCVKEGGSVIQTVDLVNSSDVEANYQWDIDCSGNSVFCILPPSGTVPPHSHATLKAVYRPTQPIAHHRRVACLILHWDPVFLDLIGTCHSELQQPTILKPEHLILYKLHWNRRQHSPQMHIAQDHKDQQGLHSPAEKSNQKVDCSVMSTTPMEEFFQTYLECLDPLSVSSLHVSVVPSVLLFNHKTAPSSLTPSALSQSVSITNHSSGKLGLVWTVSQDSPFSISPSSCDLAPLKSTSFRVTYDPKELNTLHGAQLECFAYYKESHDTGQRLLCPSWCVTVRVIGHSFQPGKEHFTPSFTLKPSQVVFPPLSVVSYSTVLLKNNGDLPLSFCLDHSSEPSSADSVLIVPSCGLIQPGNHQILTIRTIPKVDSPKQGWRLPLQLNAANVTKLTVISVLDKPRVSLEGGGSLYFQPTFVGSQTQRTHHIRNLSRLPIRFQWSIPEPDQELIAVEPDAGELYHNESSVQTWYFRPQAEKTYTLTSTLTFWPSQTDGSNKLHQTLEVVGMGVKGSIETEKAVLDVGETLLGSCQSIEIPLVNNSPCSVSFCLSVQQRFLDNEPTCDPKTEPSALQLDLDKGIIPSHSTMQLRSTVRPLRQAQYHWTVSYQTLNGSVSSPPQALCDVRAKGVFPTLQVIDICGGGGVSWLSKVQLWKLFSVDSLNKRLLCNPSSAELTFKIPTRHSLSNSPSIFTKVMLDFNFSSAAINSGASNFVLMFHNPGSVPVEWAFLFPEDQKIELEYWAVTGEFSSTELHQMKVQDNQLFSVSPRSGTLLHGQKRAVHFSYRHDFAGTHRFPVVFKLSHGREILLNFQGVTVERETPYLHFASSRHLFTSVFIGDYSPPKQMYELHNGSAVPVHYEVDTAVLSQLQEDNFNHPVLCCLNPEGEVLPGKTTTLEWIFSPLEAKMYQIDVPIIIQNGDSMVVKFEGCGLNTPTLDSSVLLTCRDSKTSVSCVQRGPFPGQVLFLSEDSVCLGDVPVGFKTSKIFFLTNVSFTETIHYTWDLPQQSNQVAQIHPERGRLCPGECSACFLIFTSTDYPTSYQLDLTCQVTLEAALIQYYHLLQRWEEENEQQQAEFTLSGERVTERQQVLEPLAARSATKVLPLRNYKTLPPICASSSGDAVGSICTKITRAERRMRKEAAKKCRPEPPQPAVLHLGVTAQSHGLREYMTYFPDQFNKNYKYLQSDKTQPLLSASTPAPEKDILVHILDSLLGNILDDSAFVQSLCHISSSPPPPTPYVVPAEITERVLMNTLQNLMTEAVRGEFVLTEQPRSLTLPPVSTRKIDTTTVASLD
ncbi:cilia- and flagella-associated protein 65 isoform X2 [Parambassis ranga]|uniref:Cilia- and flagella-associated protein 65 isoform X2 n=1 Tax=Parambassis ranga TaxID=210632 RepID=A0A6P7HES3_9TELE|nr:cilia- and flagella-associated protein 65 isoform X2 [Parambassis ranga]